MPEGAEQVAESGHNHSEIKADLKMAATAILDLERKKADIQAEISEIKRERVKKHMPISEFNAVYKLWKMERELEEDGAVKTKEAIDNIRIAFEALTPGGQADLFPDEPAEEPAENHMGDFGEQAA